MKIHELLEKYAGRPVDIISHGGMCPTQVEAEVAGYHLYYRARHGEFYVCVADTEESAVLAGSPPNEGVIYFIEGDDDTEGYVPEETYTEIVDKAIEFTLMHDAMNNMTDEDWHNSIRSICDNILKKGEE